MTPAIDSEQKIEYLTCISPAIDPKQPLAQPGQIGKMQGKRALKARFYRKVPKGSNLDFLCVFVVYSAWSPLARLAKIEANTRAERLEKQITFTIIE